MNYEEFFKEQHEKVKECAKRLGATNSHISYSGNNVMGHNFFKMFTISLDFEDGSVIGQSGKTTSECIEGIEKMVAFLKYPIGTSETVKTNNDKTLKPYHHVNELVSEVKKEISNPTPDEKPVHKNVLEIEITNHLAHSQDISLFDNYRNDINFIFRLNGRTEHHSVLSLLMTREIPIVGFMIESDVSNQCDQPIDYFSGAKGGLCKQYTIITSNYFSAFQCHRDENKYPLKYYREIITNINSPKIPFMTLGKTVFHSKDDFCQTTLSFKLLPKTTVKFTFYEGKFISTMKLMDGHEKAIENN